MEHPEFGFNTDENVAMIEKFKTRNCGACYTCCVALGIEELKKWPGQSCKHLTGANGPDHRCTIYEKRPRACSHYYCGWIANLGPEDCRPDMSGVIVTLYPPHDYSNEVITYDPGPPGPFSATIHVTDDDKAGDLADPDSKVGQMINSLVAVGCNDIRIMDSPSKAGQRVLHLHNGKIRLGRLRRPSKTGYEELVFHTEEPPIGTYLMVERGSDEEAKWQSILRQRSLRG